MDAQKASYSITLMANVLGVTRAGYYAWKNRAPQRGKRASARRRLDEAVAWEHGVSGGTDGAPRIRHALARAGVDAGVRAVAASMRRQGLPGLNTPPRPPRHTRCSPTEAWHAPARTPPSSVAWRPWPPSPAHWPSAPSAAANVRTPDRPAGHTPHAGATPIQQGARD